MKDLKYLLAYMVPVLAGFSLWAQGVWAWTAPVVIFIVLPLMEQNLTKSTENVPETQESARSAVRFFDWLLYLNIPIVYGLLAFFAWQVTHCDLNTAEWLGMVISAGIVAGACGINVAHELGHRSNPYEQLMSKILLLPSLYLHFFIEHNRGHHKHVATDLDPATARLNQSVYAFWWQSVTGSWRSAWHIETDDLKKAGRQTWSMHNRMLQYAMLHLGWLAAWGWWGGARAMLGMLLVAVVGFLLLETVNYIEHYGLRRQLLPSGRYEPVLPRHSWNSNHEIGRILLYELTRHSDHHYKSTRKYQILRHTDESPQLPFGYPGSMMIALVPPLWFNLMNKLLMTNDE